MNPPGQGLQQLQFKLTQQLREGLTVEEALVRITALYGSPPAALWAQAVPMAQMALRAISSPKRNINSATIANIMGGRAIAPAATSVLVDFTFRGVGGPGADEHRSAWITVATTTTMAQLNEILIEACDEQAKSNSPPGEWNCTYYEITGGFGFVVQPRE